jgi:ribosomal protein S18 acetylase RimI-like enzyme
VSGTPRWTIRTATPADAPAIAEVHAEGWHWGYRGLLPDAVIDAQTVEDRARFWTGVLGAPDPRGATLVAVTDAGAVLGFVAVGPSEGEAAPAPDGAGEVYAIYLRGSAQGTGVGRALFAAGCDALRAHGFERGILWVLETNATARRFYEMAGWRPDGSRGAHRFDGGDQPIVRYAVALGP